MISTKKYILGLIIILLLPIIMNLRLILFGDKVNGKVVYYKNVYAKSRYKGKYTYPIISFITKDSKQYEFMGPSNVVYPADKVLIVYFDPKNPDNNVLFNFSGLYYSNYVIIPGILLFIWSAAYFSLKERKMKEPNTKSVY